MTDDTFGHRKAIEILKENMPKLERRVESCDPDAIRLLRSLTDNNCNARVNGDIDLRTYYNNRKTIYRATEKFIDKCVVGLPERYKYIGP